MNSERYKEVIGREFPVDRGALEAREATSEGFRRFALGAGDLNPLWMDRDYAMRSAMAAVVGPPTWLFSVDNTTAAATSLGDNGERLFTDREVLLGAVEWGFDLPVVDGTTLSVTRKLLGVQKKPSRAYGEIYISDGETAFYDQQARRLAKATCTIIWRQGGSAGNQVYQPAPEAEFIHPDDAAARVERRGALPLFWEDVAIGAEIPSLQKGTLTQLEMTRWFGMARGLPRERRSDRLRWHFDPEIARASNMPTSFDEGPQRTTWMAQAITDWMGDAGRLVRLKSQIQKVNYIGYTSVVRGTVTSRNQAGGQNLATLDVWVENHLGETTARSEATVILPTVPK